jgi:hypothetical protein
MEPDKSYWFPAKTYGWGWSWPTTSQGWLVMAIYALLLIGGGVFFLPTATETFIGYATLLSAVFVAVCWLKGEPPH